MKSTNYSSGLITIITPTFNILENERKDGLLQNIKSVENQTYKMIEHLIIDGGSNDGTIEMLEDVISDRTWIKYYTEKDEGIYDAMNKGIEYSSGEYIIFLNSDDCFVSDTALEHSVKSIVERNADFSYAKAICIDEYGKESPLQNCYFPDIKHIFHEMTISHQTILCKRKLLSEHFSLKFCLGADYHWLLRICLNGAVPVFIDETIVKYSRGGASDRLKNYHKYIDERINTFLDVFREIDSKVSEYDCELIYYEKFINDRIWHLIQKNVAFEISRDYIAKSGNPVELLRKMWVVNAKNAMLIRLFQCYARKLSHSETMAAILIRMGYKSCSIYGYGNIGQCLVDDLLEREYKIVCVVDKEFGKQSNEFRGISIILPDDRIPEADVMIVTPVFFYEDILEGLKTKIDYPIIPLDDLIQ